MIVAGPNAASAQSLTSEPAAISHASSEKVLALPIEYVGIDDRQRRVLLDDRLRAGLARAGFVVGDARPKEACNDPQCRQRVAAEAGARYLVATRIDSTDRVYRLALELVDALDGRVVVTATETCDVCGLADAAKLVEDLAASLGTKLRDLSLEPPRIELDTRPVGADASLDGVKIGRTPLERVVAPGRHRLRVELRGYVPAERAITAVPGTRERVLVDLRPVGPPAARRDASTVRRAAGWGVFGVAIALLGTGTVLLALDGRQARYRCSGNDRDAFGHCRYLHETTAAGAIPVALGIAALATAVGLIASARRKPSSRGGRIASRVW